jgi:hypothetical protein
MRYGMKQFAQRSVKHAFGSLKLANRHAFMLVPLLGLTFLLIAGWVGEEYGTHFLFRDNGPPGLMGHLGFCDWVPCILRSARFHTALYATALMGMTWTLLVLIRRRDEDAADRHPFSRLAPVLPGVVVLGLVMLVAAFLNRKHPLGDFSKEGLHELGAVAVLSGIGFLAGLGVVAIVVKLGLRLSQKIQCHQLWTFLGLSAAVALVVSVLPFLTPSKVIFIALAVVTMLYCALQIARSHYRFALVALVVVLLLVGSLPQFKYQFRGLEYEESQRDEQAAPLLDLKETLNNWLSHQDPATPGRRKLVVVATSGGAYRATFWTAVVLDKLVDNPNLKGFDRAIRLMTGASGGMVGAAYFAATRKAPGDAPGDQSGQTACAGEEPKERAPRSAGGDRVEMGPVEKQLCADLMDEGKKNWAANSPIDSLTPVAKRLIGRDIPNAFWPFDWPFTAHGDRGQVLEEEWKTLDVAFRKLEEGERQGWRPSLIISPYLVDLKQPLFVSNLDLLEKEEEGIIKRGFAMEFFRKFPKAREQFKLATAVRMSATFPVISPAVRLPMTGRPRVVDAGYFDNFGVTAAATFLRHKTVRDFICEKNLDVVLVRILASAEPSPNDAPTSGPGGTESWWQALRANVSRLFSRLWDSWTSPLQGALAAHESRGQVANEMLLEDLKRRYKGRFHDVKFGYSPGKVSFSWHIQSEELKRLRSGMSTRENEEALEFLLKAWARKSNDEGPIAEQENDACRSR